MKQGSNLFCLEGGATLIFFRDVVQQRKIAQSAMRKKMVWAIFSRGAMRYLKLKSIAQSEILMSFF